MIIFSCSAGSLWAMAPSLPKCSQPGEAVEALHLVSGVRPSARSAFDIDVAGHHGGEAKVGADGGKAVVAAAARTLESAGNHGQLRISRKGGGAS
ncbi:hypothetical protein [Nonomuraea wenchangensis]|uniref:hypothetical protein n=1 Tax=Nonomuraea wenchangensis TaxID=568860 RepID=UPI0033F44F6B